MRILAPGSIVGILRSGTGDEPCRTGTVESVLIERGQATHFVRWWECGDLRGADFAFADLGRLSGPEPIDVVFSETTGEDR